MPTVIPSSINNIALTPGTPLTRKSECLKRCNLSKNSTRQTWSSQKCILPLSTSVRLFPQFRSGFSLQHKLRAPIVTATGTDLAVQETEAPTADNDSGKSSETLDNVGTSEVSSVSSAGSTTSIQKKRPKPARKSDMPPVKPEELVPGAIFTGKVKSIQPFGAFVDFGAFTDGLVHVSRLSDTFVKDVGNVVSVGQEVQVRLVEANSETGRISLTMRESDDISKLQQKTDAPASGDKPRPARKGPPRNNQKTTKFVKGQDLQGTVKNLARSGAFISLPEGEEGFLPNSEEVDEGFVSMMGGSSLEVGQEISVRVLRIARGQVTLTMKKEEDVKALDSKLSQGVVHGATNPFLLAFRKNKDIAAFLDEREKEAEPASTSDSIDAEVSETEATLVETASEEVVTEATTIEEASKEIDGDTKSSEPTSGTALAVDEVKSNGEGDVPEQSNDQVSSENQVAEITIDNQSPENLVTDTLQSEDRSAGIIEEKEEVTSELLPSEEGYSASEEVSKGDESENILPISESATSTEVTVSETDEAITKEEKLVAAPSEETEVVSGKEAEDEKTETNADTNGSVTSSNVETPVVEQNKTQAAVSPALVKKLREETGAGMMDCKKALSETGGDLIKAQEFLRKKGLASADKKSSRVTAEGRIGSYIHDSRIGILLEVNCETDFVSRGDIFKELVDDLAMQVAACPQVAYVDTDEIPKELIEKEKDIEMQKEDLISKPEQIRSKIVEGRIRKRLEELALLEQPYIKNDKMVVKDWVKQTIATIGENIKVKRFVRFNLGEGLEKRSQDFAAEVAAQTAAKPVPAPSKDQPAVSEATAVVDTPPKAAISAGLVKQLREETGAGMMDCKKALAETGGDLEKAQEYLRKKGLSAADKKSSRLAAEGRIGSYIHDARIGVLIEVNCETDFVGRGEQFKELVDDLAMQVAACPQVQYVSIEDIPESIISNEKALEMQREDLLSKPENIREKIVDGRISKRLGELALLEQPYIKNDSILVKDLVKQTVAALGENIKVRRFVRFTLGEASESPETEVKA